MRKRNVFCAVLLSAFSWGALAADVQCPAPKSIKDFVECQNKIAAAHTDAQISHYISVYRDYGKLACTRSGASAQPAFPFEGDLRCFLVFPSGATMSFNLVAGKNENHIEVSELAKSDLGEDGVLLAFFRLDKPISFEAALASSSTELNDRGLTCAFCHFTLGRDQVSRDDFKAWVLVPIRINSSVRGTIPRNGQVRPEELDQVLADLDARHRCSVGRSETCDRLSVIRGVTQKLPLDNPLGQTL